MAIHKEDVSTELLSNRENISYDLDNGIGSIGVIGLLVLQSDQTIEDEFRAVLPSGVALYQARLKSPKEITPKTLLTMEGDISKTVSLLPDIKFDVIGFGCTSGALIIGENRVAEHVHEVKSDVAVTDPVTATLAAFKALDAKRIALLTPYIAEINHSLRNSLIERGLSIPIMGSFNEPDDYSVAKITAASIASAVLSLGASADCDAVFVSCTNLRVARIVQRIEDQIGKPVTSSNHALAWHMLRLAGFKEAMPGYGRLFHV